MSINLPLCKSFNNLLKYSYVKCLPHRFELLNTFTNDELEGNSKNFSKKDYCNYIVGLESYRIISKRVELLERNLIHNM